MPDIKEIETGPVEASVLQPSDPDWKSEQLGKRYARWDDMIREWQALQECRGFRVQKTLEMDEKKQLIHFEFDAKARPLSSFGKDEQALFIELLPEIIRAINHCHQNGWVHGDIKPSNILFIPQNRTVRLVDFGASYRVGTSRSDLPTWQVTPMFASANQIDGCGVVDIKDDWFALVKLIEIFIRSCADEKCKEKAISVRSIVERWL
ncbi:serine/threonine protein kinase [Photobacterium marinum]|uniref:Serine/threonine protein kinase n=1 Tax=Photobacterium marinum TaxID=1056511 RepID=L8JIK7_9GAMM|nr:serine/threonine protein kinase [Photobacterium marinum]ELR67252.1 serine/threonine protein kinase [Photobacterium marinum]